MRKECYLKKITRSAYGPTYKCSGKSSIIMAPLVTGIIPKGKYSEEVWTDILVSKYMGHVPVDRQLFEIVQAGIDIKEGKELFLEYKLEKRS